MHKGGFTYQRAVLAEINSVLEKHVRIEETAGSVRKAMFEVVIRFCGALVCAAIRIICTFEIDETAQMSIDPFTVDRSLDSDFPVVDRASVRVDWSKRTFDLNGALGPGLHELFLNEVQVHLDGVGVHRVN